MNLSVCASLQLRPLTGTWYRAIQPQHWTTCLQTNHTKFFSGRFHLGSSSNPTHEVLYLAENPIVALFEVEAVFGSFGVASQILANPRASFVSMNVNIQLQYVADVTSEITQAALQVSAQELTGDWKGYTLRNASTSIVQPVAPAPTHRLGEAMFSVPKLEAFQTVSAKCPCNRCLVIFPEKVRASTGSRIEFLHPQTGQNATIP